MSSNPYCVVRSFTSTLGVHLIKSFSEFVSLLEPLKVLHNDFTKTYTLNNPDIDASTYLDFGYTLELERRDGGLVAAQVSEYGWMLIRMVPEPIAFFPARSNFSPVHSIVITSPEWTEYDVLELIDKRAALEILHAWLDRTNNSIDI